MTQQQTDILGDRTELVQDAEASSGDHKEFDSGADNPARFEESGLSPFLPGSLDPDGVDSDFSDLSACRDLREWPYVVTVDGPGASGKSTLGALLAEHYETCFLDTGAIYRALALLVRRDPYLDWNNADQENEFAELAEVLSEGYQIRRDEASGDIRLYMGREDITDQVYSDSISQGASIVSMYPKVRQALLPLQRRLGEGGAVVVGRDAGTVIFPSADVKIFLTAAAEARAMRRLVQEYVRNGENSPEQIDTDSSEFKSRLAEVTSSIQERDTRDTTRDVAPLIAPAGCVRIDSTNDSLESVVQRAVHEIDKIINQAD